jgi:hypothetical protein
VRKRTDKSFLRTGHGNGAGSPRIETPPVDELAAGLPAPSRVHDAATAQALASVSRVAGGKLADSESARVLGRMGGLAKAERDRQLAECPKLVRGLGLRDITSVELAPYIDDATEFAQAEIERLARVVGGGECSSAPASIVGSAALQLAGSRCAFARGDIVTGSRLANDSRQNMLAAHELCAREAMARNRPGVRGVARTDEHDALVRQRVAEATAQAIAPADFDAELDEDSDP